MTKERSNNEFPFAQPLRSSEFSDSIKEFKNHPDSTVRIFRTDFFINDYNNLTAGEDKIESAAEAAAKLKEMHRELADLGINLSAEYVVGKDEKGEENIFVVSDKIIGEQIKEIGKKELGQPERENLRKEFSRLFSALISYLEKRFKDNDVFFCDIFHFRQCKYGHSAQGASSPDKVYLIDIEPILHSPFLELNGYRSILDSIRDLDQHIAVVSEILGGFPELSNRLDRLASEVYKKDVEYRQKNLEAFEKEQQEK